jgi:hypothetical protein
MEWLWIFFWILLAILITGTILFLIGLEAPHKDKPDNTVNYETLKWVGIALLITGGVGMLIWAYFKFRKPKPMMSGNFSDNRMSNTSSRYSSFNGSMSNTSMDSDTSYFINSGGKMRPQKLTYDQEESLRGLESYLKERGYSY